MFPGADAQMEGGDAMLAVQVLRDYFQPDAVGRIFTQVEKFTSYARADKTVGKFLTEFGIFRRIAEKHMSPAGGVSRAIYLLLVHPGGTAETRLKNSADCKHGGTY